MQLAADGGAEATVMEAADAVENGAADAAQALQPAIEDARARRERWRSVYVIYFTMFQMSLGFSIVLTGVWPYLDKASLTNFVAHASNCTGSVQGIGISCHRCVYLLQIKHIVIGITTPLHIGIRRCVYVKGWQV